jgi:hypothetical protein
MSISNIYSTAAAYGHSCSTGNLHLLSKLAHGTIDASALDNQPKVPLRLHFSADSKSGFDSPQLGDIALSREPYECNYGTSPDTSSLVSPTDGCSVTSPKTFVWKGAAAGSPAAGYIVYLDEGLVATLTEPILSIPLDMSPAHTTGSFSNQQLRQPLAIRDLEPQCERYGILTNDL